MVLVVFRITLWNIYNKTVPPISRPEIRFFCFVPVGYVQHFAKRFSVVNHFVKNFPGFIIVRWGNNKLFNLFKLVDTKDTTGITSMASNLLPETRRETCILKYIFDYWLLDLNKENDKNYIAPIFPKNLPILSFSWLDSMKFWCSI